MSGKQQRYFNYCINSDMGGCGFYRILFPALSVQTMFRNVITTTTMRPVLEPKFFQGMRSIKMQRPTSESQCKLVVDFIKPVSDQHGCWLIIDVDDVIVRKDIPKYNLAINSFTDAMAEYLKKMMHLVDIITVTTDVIADEFQYFSPATSRSSISSHQNR